jgi:hypothetical protein
MTTATPKRNSSGPDLPEFMLSPDLGEWLAAKIEQWVARDKTEAVEQNQSRVRAAEIRMGENAGAQIVSYHTAMKS